MSGQLPYEDQLRSSDRWAARSLLPLVRLRFCGHMEYDESSTRLSLSGPTAPSITREPLTNAESFDRSL